MKLYHAPWSPNCLKVKIALAELGRSDDVELADYDPYGSRVLAETGLNPNNKVPTLVDGDAVFWESASILLHLAHKYGALLPEAPADRAMAVGLLFFETGSIAPVIGGDGIFGELMKPEAERDMARVGSLVERLGPRLAVLDTVLGDGRPYVAREFSIADIQLFVGLSKVVEHQVAPTSSLLGDWIGRVAEREAVRKELS